MRTLRETNMDLIYMGNSKRQHFPSKLGAWVPWRELKGRRGARRGTEKNVNLNLNFELECDSLPL